MPNGNVLTKEIGDDIKKLQSVELKGACKACAIIKDGLIRALRIGEENYKMNRINTALLFFIVLLVAKIDNVGVLDLLVKLITGGK